MEVQTRTHIYTPEEYLKLEETAPYKSEYRVGQLYQLIMKLELNKICKKY